MRSLTALSILLAVALTACAPVSERMREARDYQRVEHEAEYLEYVRSCRKRGGLIYVQATGRISRGNLPRRSDRYRCL